MKPATLKTYLLFSSYLFSANYRRCQYGFAAILGHLGSEYATDCATLRLRRHSVGFRGGHKTGHRRFSSRASGLLSRRSCSFRSRQLVGFGGSCHAPHVEFCENLPRAICLQCERRLHCLDVLAGHGPPFRNGGLHAAEINRIACLAHSKRLVRHVSALAFKTAIVLVDPGMFVPVPHWHEAAYCASDVWRKAPGLHENALRKSLVGFRLVRRSFSPGCDSLQNDVDEPVERKILFRT